MPNCRDCFRGVKSFQRTRAAIGHGAMSNLSIFLWVQLPIRPPTCSRQMPSRSCTNAREITVGGCFSIRARITAAVGVICGTAGTVRRSDVTVPKPSRKILSSHDSVIAAFFLKNWLQQMDRLRQLQIFRRNLKNTKIFLTANHSLEATYNTVRKNHSAKSRDFIFRLPIY